MGEWLQGLGHGRSGCSIDLENCGVIIGPIGQCMAGDFATVQHVNPFDWTRQTVLDWDEEMGKLSIDLKAIGGHIIVCLVMEDLFFKVCDVLAMFHLQEGDGIFLHLNGAE